ncbi:hypothetical protein ACFVRU_47140 [Streptomyces sp. NPDC057927]
MQPHRAETLKLSRTPCSSTADESPVRTLVALQEIADDAGVTPDLVSGVPVPAEVWDQTELRENLAEAIVDFWKDADVREPALALERSSDLDDGLLQSLESLGTSAGRRDSGTSTYGAQARSLKCRAAVGMPPAEDWPVLRNGDPGKLEICCRA